MFFQKQSKKLKQQNPTLKHESSYSSSGFWNRIPACNKCIDKKNVANLQQTNHPVPDRGSGGFRNRRHHNRHRKKQKIHRRPFRQVPWTRVFTPASRKGPWPQKDKKNHQSCRHLLRETKACKGFGWCNHVQPKPHRQRAVYSPFEPFSHKKQNPMHKTANQNPWKIQMINSCNHRNVKQNHKQNHRRG